MLCAYIYMYIIHITFHYVPLYIYSLSPHLSTGPASQATPENKRVPWRLRSDPWGLDTSHPAVEKIRFPHQRLAIHWQKCIYVNMTYIYNHIYIYIYISHMYIYIYTYIIYHYNYSAYKHVAHMYIHTVHTYCTYHIISYILYHISYIIYHIISYHISYQIIS